MKILLCQSYLGPNNQEPLVFPLGLAYIASMLEDKHELMGFDPSVVQNPLNELSSILEDFHPDIVGVSLRNIDGIFSFYKCSYYLPFVSLIRHIKKTAPWCRLVVGGAGFSAFPEEIMARNPEIDFGMISEGEYTFAQLAENLGHPELIQNLYYRRAEKVVFTGKAPLADFDTLPSPSRTIFDLAMYKNKPAVGIQSKRGCNYGCIYCLHAYYMGSSCRLRQPKKIVDEIEVLVNEHDINYFYLVDPVFNFPLNHSREICHEITQRKLDIKWEAAFRPDLVNAPFMEECVKAGCTLFDFSPDGASDDALSLLGKSYTVETIEKTINLVRKTENAKVSYEFMYDLPGKNAGHIIGLARLFPKIVSLDNKLSSLTLSKMRIFPHTKLYDIALEQGKINQKTDLLFPTHYESGPASLASILPPLIRKAALTFQKIKSL